MKVTINVEQRHIDESIRLEKNRQNRRCKICPVAVAVRERFTSREDWIVNGVTIFSDTNPSKEVKLPREVVNFITKADDFSNQNKIKPFSFEIEVPEDFLKA